MGGQQKQFTSGHKVRAISLAVKRKKLELGNNLCEHQSKS